jgi:Protein of unknown function (DUF2817)
MEISGYFSANYAAAREKFRNAAASASAALEGYHNPATGPDDLALSTETAWLGPRDAERVLVIMSGTHGAETFCGSGIQIGLLRSGIAEDVAKNVGLLLIHAINPSGFAWIRRVTEGNIDLNRNFIDHRRPHPKNPGYDLLRDAICPPDWSETVRAAADAKLQAFGAKHGPMALQSAITMGQYVDDKGVFYGGLAPTWSNRTLREILIRNAADARHVGFIDLHTGLGPYGFGEIISNHRPQDSGFARIKDWFGGEATSSEDGSSTSAPVAGDTNIGLEAALPRAQVGGVTLEYGTEPLRDMIDAVRGDNWLHAHGRLDSAEGRAIKARMRQAFYPDADDWRSMVWERAVDVTQRMVKGLSQS